MHHIKPFITCQTGKRRLGKGFSPDEIKEAGITVKEAREIGMPVDFKRKTSHEENIKNLKVHAEKAQAAVKPKPAQKKEKKPKN